MNDEWGVYFQESESSVYCTSVECLRMQTPEHSLIPALILFRQSERLALVGLSALIGKV